VLFSAAIGLTAAALRISEDRDLIDVDLNTWNCRDRAEGSARVPDGAERNRLKNRSAPAAMPTEVKTFDTAGFLRYVGAFDAQSKERRRKEITPGQKPQLDALEQQIVTLTGYLGYAYAGPGETTNCGSIDIHDWHLEIFDKPPEHPPQPGDVTPIVCEITPRFQHALFSENIRVQKLAAFFRRPDLGYEATGHPAVKVRITGYLLWDDEHNGEKDAGLAVRTAPPNAYHNPWRATAW
jgi:hypothetical protein